MTHWRHFRLTEEEEELNEEAGYYLELQSALGRYLQLLPGLGGVLHRQGSAIPNTEPRWRGLKAPSTAHTRLNLNILFEMCVYEWLVACVHMPAWQACEIGSNSSSLM